MTTVPPEPFTLSYKRCIVRRRRATSFCSYTCAASTTHGRDVLLHLGQHLRAFFSRSAWASVDMTSCSSRDAQQVHRQRAHQPLRRRDERFDGQGNQQPQALMQSDTAKHAASVALRAPARIVARKPRNRA